LFLPESSLNTSTVASRGRWQQFDTTMKFIAFLFLVISVLSYSTAPPRYIPKDFNYPNNKIGSGKTFVYKNSDSNQYYFTDIKLINDKGYRSIKNYEEHSIKDSLITYNDRTIENYNFIISGDSKVVKGEKLQDTILDNSKKLGKHYTLWSFRTSKVLFTFAAEEEYDKDTTINWQNHPLKCLVTQGYKVLQYDSNYNNRITYFFNHYYAKGIGLIRYYGEYTDYHGKYHSNTWNLVNIKEIQ